MLTAMAGANCSSGAPTTMAVPTRSIASPPTGYGRCLRETLKFIGLFKRAIEFRLSDHRSSDHPVGLQCLPLGVRPMRTTSRIAILACLSAGWCFAQDHDFSKVQIKVSKVAGNVYMLVGAGGNIGASVGDDGIVIVDDQYAPLGRPVRSSGGKDSGGAQEYYRQA